MSETTASITVVVPQTMTGSLTYEVNVNVTCYNNDYTLNGSVTLDVTNIWTVTFIDGDNWLKSVDIRDGDSVAPEDMPTVKTRTGYDYAWMVGEETLGAVVSDVTASLTWTLRTPEITGVEFSGASTEARA